MYNFQFGHKHVDHCLLLRMAPCYIFRMRRFQDIFNEAPRSPKADLPPWIPSVTFVDGTRACDFCVGFVRVSDYLAETRAFMRPPPRVPTKKEPNLECSR